MAYRIHPTGELLRTNPKRAARELASMLRAENGNVARVAVLLGVDYRTAARWIASLAELGFDLRPAIERARELAKRERLPVYRPRKNAKAA